MFIGSRDVLISSNLVQTRVTLVRKYKLISKNKCVDEKYFLYEKETGVNYQEFYLLNYKFSILLFFFVIFVFCIVKGYLKMR